MRLAGVGGDMESRREDTVAFGQVGDVTGDGSGGRGGRSRRLRRRRRRWRLGIRSRSAVPVRNAQKNRAWRMMVVMTTREGSGAEVKRKAQEFGEGLKLVDCVAL
eukprot:GFKZ01009548.1.p4 GENE.GFKZ01009548.1~~GFKZ01009548.1.p4  ORF type:complete len:105 (-),score=17.67 GFKZ01009548.1:222-536(-)